MRAQVGGWRAAAKEVALLHYRFGGGGEETVAVLDLRIKKDF